MLANICHNFTNYWLGLMVTMRLDEVEYFAVLESKFHVHIKSNEIVRGQQGKAVIHLNCILQITFSKNEKQDDFETRH